MYNIYLEIEKIKEKYNLTGFKQKNGYIFYGELILNHTYENITLKNSLYISMFVPFTFPTDLPIVRDITKKIESEFHKNKNDILCLACDAEIHYELKRNNSVTICDFIEKFLIPYLYSYTYYKKYNKIPYGQRSHGFQGVIEFYMDYFEINNTKIVLNILNQIVLNKYKGHNICPCGSGEKFRKCHANSIFNLLKIVGIDNIEKDLLYIKRQIKTIVMMEHKRKKQAKKFNYYLFPPQNTFKINEPKFYRRHMQYMI